MSKLDVLIHRLLHIVGILLPPRLRNDMPYELLNARVDVFLTSARHDLIFALLVRRICRPKCDLTQGVNRNRIINQAGIVSSVAAVRVFYLSSQVGSMLTRLAYYAKVRAQQVGKGADWRQSQCVPPP